MSAFNLEKSSVSSLLLLLFPLCLFIHALLNCSVHWFDAADPERLRHFPNLLLLCCCSGGCNSLITPSANVCVCSFWLMRAGLWGQGCKIIWRSWSLHLPGVLLWWTTLWMSVTSGLGGLPKRRERQHAPSPPPPRHDGRSLICTENWGEVSDYLSSSCHLFFGNNLITEGVSAVITRQSNLHINAPWIEFGCEVRGLFLITISLCHSRGYGGVENKQTMKIKSISVSVWLVGLFLTCGC